MADSGVGRFLPAHAPLVVATRGGTTESVHYGSIAVVDRSGKLVAGAGDPEALSFTRSALKPFQALPLVEDGGLGRYGFGSHELALMCASHSGEPIHQEIAARILDRIGAGESALQCGSHAPAFYAANNLAPPQRKWSALCHNCSGKHSGFLAWCRLHGRPLAEYLDPAAPLQRRIEAGIRRLLPGATLARGTDGCSAPNYAFPLAGLAHLYARLADGESDELAAIRFAMTRHPDLVSGTRRADLALMLAGGGDWIAKAGAAGVQAMGVRSRGLGIAIRIADGNVAALRLATVAVLEQLQLGKMPEDFAATVIRNDRGTEVGAMHARFEL
jgi:L-asparaginase II